MAEFSEEEMTIEEMVGYPKAYAKLCRSSGSHSYIHGPPLAFLPYSLNHQEDLRAKSLNQMFPVIDPEARSTSNPRGYVNLLWKQLDHLGNAGFDPALFRVDTFGNVLYLHADSASPLAWDIDHWFPCSRGGRTVPGNLRLLQWQVCKKKKNKLDFLVPWWDLQLGISVSQFLSMFACSNSDFRNRAFSFLFLDGANEELNSLLTIESHSFPQRFIEMKRKVGSAPAAVVSSKRSSDESVLKSLDINRSLRNNSPLTALRKYSADEDDTVNTAIQKFRPSISKENNILEIDDENSNPYFTITKARDSLRQREESKKKQAEISGLEDELNALKQKNDTERDALQDLEAMLIKRRRRVEKCRRLAEAQSSYRALLEKMIRDAMHQSVVYKEQLRLNQAATSALMARLEAQRSICDSSENELRRRFKQRDEIEKQLSPCSEKARKRSRVDNVLFEERQDNSIQTERRDWSSVRKELRVFLEEEQKASEAGLSLSEKENEESSNTIDKENDGRCRALVLADGPSEEHCSKVVDAKKKISPQCQQEEIEEEHRSLVVAKEDLSLNGRLKELAIRGRNCTKSDEIKELAIRDGCCSKSNVEEAFQKVAVAKDDISSKNNMKEIRESSCSRTSLSTKQSLFQQSPHEQDDEYSKRVGRGNVEKWLQVLLENAKEGSSSSMGTPSMTSKRQENHTDEIVHRLNLVNPQKEIKYLRLKPLEKNPGFNINQDKQQKEETSRSEKRKKSVAVEMRNNTGFDSATSFEGVGSRKGFDVKETQERKGGVASCESSRGFRSFQSSPSVILGMRRGVECIGKKPKVMGDDDDEGNIEVWAAASNNQFIRSRTRTSKKTVNK